MHPAVAATPTARSGMSAKVRLLVVYGSESGNAKRGITRWIKKWEASESVPFTVVDFISGNELYQRCGGSGQAQAKNLESVAQCCDVLLVATSSYGDGDPPSNMRDLVQFLQHEASMNSDALVGVQHAVLGFGSSTYTTFQNIPRLTDKFLGACGSRRLAMRAEVRAPSSDAITRPAWRRARPLNVLTSLYSTCSLRRSTSTTQTQARRPPTCAGVRRSSVLCKTCRLSAPQQVESWKSLLRPAQCPCDAPSSHPRVVCALCTSLRLDPAGIQGRTANFRRRR